MQRGWLDRGIGLEKPAYSPDPLLSLTEEELRYKKIISAYLPDLIILFSLPGRQSVTKSG
jgi:hypothetical protein